MRFLVWSNEHRMSIDEAGRYERAVAAGIVARATLDGQLTYRRTDPYTGEEYSQLSEVVVLAPECIPGGATDA